MLAIRRFASCPLRAVRARVVALALFAAVAILALAACGSQGYAPPLGQVASVTLPAQGAAGPAGTATLMPIRGVRVAVYYHGNEVPLVGVKTPVELRNGACDGPVVAALTDGVPSGQSTAAPAAGSPPVVVQPAGDGSVYVSVAPSANLYTVLLGKPNDPTAPILACGHPLSERRQYFDLYLPNEVGDGIARGTALYDPINVARVQLSISDAAGAHPVSWSVRTGSCGGPSIGGGNFASGATSADGVVFKTLDTSSWWLSVAQSNGATSCAQVK